MAFCDVCQEDKELDDMRKRECPTCGNRICKDCGTCKDCYDNYVTRSE